MTALRGVFLVGISVLLSVPQAEAKPKIRDTFFSVYPDAVGTRLELLSNGQKNCGLCHLDITNGGGPRNPYGDALAAIGGLNNTNQIINAINTVASGDQDGDGFTSLTEITDPSYANTPTFPGWSQANLGDIDPAWQPDFLPHLTPTITVDTTPPTVTLVAPDGGETLTANQAWTVMWVATDASGIAVIHLYVSLDDGANYTPVALGLPDTGGYSWIPANRPTTTARLRVVAVDNAGNSNNDESDAAFTIVSPTLDPPPAVPTTLRDFDMPGSQPFEGGAEAADPSECAACHGNYNPAVEPYHNWRGSMMSLAGLDPLFEASLAIANQDAPESGDLCLRCHISRGWLQGRSVPTDGSSMTDADLIGISCDLCHRMVDPVYDAGIDPLRDAEVLAALRNPGTELGNGMFVVDPSGIQRGPFPDPETPHSFLESPFHRESAICGTCHNVSNPAFTKNETTGEYDPNAFDTPAPDFSPESMAPVERTYSEWLHSEYATTGVYAPEFAGNKADGIVGSCQDCHMRDVSGKGCNVQGAPTRPDLPLHDMTGGSTWLPPLIAQMHPDKVDAAAVADGVTRATYMLENAATIDTTISNGDLVVRVTNETGHKLPTGYPEGRRIWLNVKFFDASSNLIGESGAYDDSTAELSHDPEAKIYAVHPGIGDNISTTVGLPVGPSSHFVLNNKIFEDNRIPPRGFTNAAYASFGGAPVGHHYDDGQHWDDTPYDIPAGTMRAEVRLYYQSTSKELIEFLRDENTTDNTGQVMYDLWNDNDRCPPVLMEQAEWVADPITFAGLESATPGVESATLSWSAAGSSCPPVTYSIYQATTSGGQDFGTPLTTTTSTSVVVPLDPGTTSPETYYFVVRASDGCGASEANTVEIAVQPLLDPAKDQDGDGMPNGFEEDHGLSPFDPGDALLDPDRDGLTSLEEAAFGSDPDENGSAHHPAGVEVDDGGTLYYGVSYTRVKGLTTAEVTAEVSGDLFGWNSGPTYTTIVSVTDNGDDTETVVERMNAPISAAPHSFMRMHVVTAVQP